MRKSVDLPSLDQLETLEARAVYQLIDLIIAELPPEDPFITDFAKPLMSLSKGACIQIDEDPEARIKARVFLGLIHGAMHGKKVVRCRERME